MLRISFMRNYYYYYYYVRNFCLIRSTPNRSVDNKKNLLYGGNIREIPDGRSLGRVLYDRLRDPSRANKIIQVCSATGVSMTTQTFLMQSVAVAESLRERNIRKGDFILVVGNNSLNMNVTLAGIFIMGAIAVPISYFANPDDLRHLFTNIQPKFFICDGQTLFTVRRIINSVFGHFDEKKVILLNDSKYLDTTLQCFPEFIKGKGDNWESFKPVEVQNPKEELALVMKSISEGAGSRGVCLTHSNLLAVINRYDATQPIQMMSEVILMVQRIIWMSGIMGLMASCYFGSKLVVMSEFDEEEFLKSIEAHKVTMCFLYPAKVWQLYKYTYQNKYDVSSCKVYASGYGMPKSLIGLMKEKNGLTIVPCYGMTEMSGTVIEYADDSKEGSIGKLLPLCYAKVISVKTNQKYGPNQVGEICFKGPTLMKGYFNDEKATRDVIDKDGFLHTGDYGYYDEDGNIFIVDKLKQVIKYKNNEISPLELEGVLKSFDAIKDCVVSGIPHPKDGYHVVAFVVLQSGKTATADDIKKFVEDKLPEHKHLKGGVVFIPKVPRSRESGFIKRSAINKVLAKYRIVTDTEPDIPIRKEEPERMLKLEAPSAEPSPPPSEVKDVQK